MKRILIIGGTGAFGQKLVHHLAKNIDAELIITSRNAARAINFVHILKQTYKDKIFDNFTLDYRKGFDAALTKIAPDITIDCSGPFQGANYDVATQVLAAGSHFIDMADAPSYLENYTQSLDDIAKTNNVTCIGGASSSPAITATAAAQLVKGWRRVDHLELAFAPGGKGDVGASVIAAILSYAGKPISTWNEGRLASTRAWTHSKIINFPKLGARKVSPAETFDAQYLGPKHQVQSGVSFSAGLESKIEQYGIMALANLAKWGVPINKPSIANKLAKSLIAARSLTKIGTSDRGGMIVRAAGLDADNLYKHSEYFLLAGDNHGPNIPILPVAAALRKLMEDDVSTGAFLAQDTVSLGDIEAEFVSYSISAEITSHYPSRGIYTQHLGSLKFDKMPAKLQEFHKVDAYPVWQGAADITASDAFIPKLIAKFVGFPPSGKNVPLTVSVTKGQTADGCDFEQWTRNFNGKLFQSQLTAERDGTFRERFGPLSFVIDLDAGENGITMPIKNWRIETPFGNIPMPTWLAPKSETREYMNDDGKFCFDVNVSLPMFGPLAHYRGWLEAKTL